MFRSIFTSLSIYLQGTLFERRPRVKGRTEQEELLRQRALHEEDEFVHPYVLLNNHESAARYDLISKMHGADSRLPVRRGEAKKAREKWCQNNCEQHYSGQQMVPDPQVEVYWRSLGLNHAQEQELDW